MAESSGIPESPTRRGVVAAAGGVGLAAVLTACGSGSSSHSSDDAAGSSSASPAPSGGADSGSPAAGGGGGGSPLAKTSEIPVGGGKIFAAQKVVVTQPSSGQFKAFSAVCTHQGCTVAKVSDGQIICPCHGSAFHVADGSVAKGPATTALPAKNVTVSGDEVTLA